MRINRTEVTLSERPNRSNRIGATVSKRPYRSDRIGANISERPYGSVRMEVTVSSNRIEQPYRSDRIHKYNVYISTTHVISLLMLNHCHDPTQLRVALERLNKANFRQHPTTQSSRTPSTACHPTPKIRHIL